MATWKNGYIPDSELVRFGETGWNEVDGDWYWALTAPTLARVRRLIALAKARTGRDLSPGDGFSCYRPYGIQVKAKNKYGIGAATPGWSSHGGFWEGIETMAVDFSNWGYVYNWDREAFYADCWAAGLVPGMIEPRRGYPDEPWHVIDMNPRTMPAFASTSSEEDGSIMATDAQNLQASLDLQFAKTQAMIHDRKDVVVVWTPQTDKDPRTAWVVDHGAGTKRNVHKGIANTEDAIKYVAWLQAQGIPVIDGDQPPLFLSGYRDISV